MGLNFTIERLWDRGRGATGSRGSGTVRGPHAAFDLHFSLPSAASGVGTIPIQRPKYVSFHVTP